MKEIKPYLDVNKALDSLIADYPRMRDKVCIYDPFKHGLKHIWGFVTKIPILNKLALKTNFIKRIGETTGLHTYDIHALYDEYKLEINAQFSAICGLIKDPTFPLRAFIVTIPSHANKNEIISHISQKAHIKIPESFDDSAIHRWILEHEFAHALRSQFILHRQFDHLSSEQRFFLEENVADAFALIRHYQRHGLEDGFIQFIADVRAYNVLYKSDTSHFTSNVIDQIIEDARRGALDNLSPEETLKTAVKIAERQDFIHFVDLATTRTIKDYIEDYGYKLNDPAQALDAVIGLAHYFSKAPAVLKMLNRYLIAFENLTDRAAYPENLLDKAHDAVEQKINMLVIPKAKEDMRKTLAEAAPRVEQDAKPPKPF